MICAEYSRSEIASTLTSEVPLSMEMTWLPVGGRTTRIACGRMTRRISLPAVHAQRPRGVVLALVHRADAAADDLGHVGGLVQRQPQQCRAERGDQHVGRTQDQRGAAEGQTDAITG